MNKNKVFSNRKVGVAVVQWEMKVLSFRELLQRTERFIEKANQKKADFIVFPEFFSLSLYPLEKKKHPQNGLEMVAEKTDMILQKTIEYAVDYQINIIVGSMPVSENEKIYNVGYLCRRDGSTESYKKIHHTPSEKQEWNMKDGNKIAAFSTDCGKIGIQICYDVEFPEGARLLAQQGVDILFVPYRTNTLSGYNRVRFCAQARAVENECYVAISGSYDGLENIPNLETHYSQSAILTPLDQQFPEEGIQKQASPNQEALLFSEVDISLLHQLHESGSVQNLKDRRTDVYRLENI